MNTITQNIVVYKGATFSLNVALLDSNSNPYPSNTSGFTANAQVRPNFSSNNASMFTVQVNVGGITLGMNATTTANLEPGFQVYDVLVNDPVDSAVYRVLQGTATVLPNVTR